MATNPTVTLDLYGSSFELDSLWLRDRCDSIADDPKRPGDSMVRLLGMHMAAEWMTTLGAVSDADDGEQVRLLQLADAVMEANADHPAGSRWDAETLTYSWEPVDLAALLRRVELHHHED